MTLMKRKQLDRDGIVRGGDHAGLVDEALTREVIRAFYTVYNTLGHGFLVRLRQGSLHRAPKARTSAARLSFG